MRISLTKLLLAFALPSLAAQAQMSALHASGTNIVNASGSTVTLKGVNLGGWFIMESFMTPIDSGGTYNTDMHSMMAELDSRFGVATEQSLINTYQTHFITTADLDNIKNKGLNAVRIPIWWGMFFPLSSQAQSAFRSDSFTVLDSIINACASRGIYVVLDMHGALGSQSGAENTGHYQDGGVNGSYFSSSFDQSQTVWLWQQIATHYKASNFANASTIAGFDLLNEPVGGTTSQVITQYDAMYSAIRTIDPSRMIFLETISSAGYAWSTLPAPSVNNWTNVVYETHVYCGASCTAAQVSTSASNSVNGYNNIITAGYNVPGYIGEYSAYNTGYSEWQTVQTTYADAGLSRTMWNYKANTTAAYDYWGWYCPGSTRPTTPNIGTDSSSTISADWSGWTTSPDFVVNSNIHM